MTNIDDEAQQSTEMTRRMMLRGATVSGVALPFLAACGGDDGGSSSGSGSGSDSGSGGGPGGGAVTVKKSDVPVGSGVILSDEKVVVTQPTEGDFKAFTAVCTHEKCTVARFVDNKIHCNCHGSEFSIEDGHNVTGPSGREAGSVGDLAAKKVSVKGDQISVS